MVVFGQTGCILATWLYSGKVVVFGQKGCIPSNVAVFEQNRLYSAKWLYSDKSGCIREKWL